MSLQGQYVQIVGLPPSEDGENGTTIANGTVCWYILQEHGLAWVMTIATDEVYRLPTQLLSTCIQLPRPDRVPMNGCLGGGKLSRVPPDSAATTHLPRPPPKGLPPHHFKNSKLPIKDKQLKRAYLKIYQGDCDLTFTCQRFQKTHHKAELVVSLPGMDNLFVVQFDSEKSEIVTGANKNFWKDCLTGELECHLQRRVLHLAVRSGGNAYLGIPLSMEILNRLTSEYKVLGWHGEDLDAAILGVDLLFSEGKDIDRSEALGSRLYGVGECLECLGRFAEAAHIYLQASEECFSGNMQKQRLCHLAAGLAFKRCGDYNKAESHYVKALHLDITNNCSIGQAWDVNHKETFTCLDNLMILYNQIDSCGGQGYGNQRSLSHKHVEEAFIMRAVFVSLLHVAGKVDTCSGKNFHSSENLIIHQKYRNKTAAVSVLLAALQSGNVSEFRATVMKCLTPETSLKAYSIPKNADSSKKQNKEAKKAARSYRQEFDTEAVFQKCANPTCRTEHDLSGKLLFCPCKTVFYCNKDCQKEHWHAGHKKVCTFVGTKTKSESKNLKKKS